MFQMGNFEQALVDVCMFLFIIIIVFFFFFKFIFIFIFFDFGVYQFSSPHRAGEYDVTNMGILSQIMTDSCFPATFVTSETNDMLGS